ncbi:nucleoside/nucleotide kinase family protein [Streptomyces mutabilis]|uniref:nucleoside/nucleotide kinase family protein n=1 Tax=Streptomyces TaxID=1883 RepID=UPI0036C9E800
MTAAQESPADVAPSPCARIGESVVSADPGSTPAVVRASIAELAERARSLAGPGRRRVLGITGAPGAGKSTLARQLVEALGPQTAALVPMDGFHLSNAVLRALARHDRKGAWDTFDADGYVHLMQRLRSRAEPVVYAPDFDRGIEESIGSALPVPREIPLIITEGNYLLSDEGSWPGAAALLDETWYLAIDDGLRHQRLVARHEAHGKTHDLAVVWTHGSDETNAEVVARSRSRADLVVTVQSAAQAEREAQGSTAAAITAPVLQRPGAAGGSPRRPGGTAFQDP